MGRSMGASFQSDDFVLDPQNDPITPLPNEPVGYRMPETATAFCLGQPAHPVQSTEVICRLCGNLVAGAYLGVYQIQQVLGRGRSGLAYLATHQRSKQAVVIKLFPPDATSIGLWDAARRDTRVATALRHPSILPVFSCTTWQPESRSQVSRPLHELMTSYPGQEVYLLTLCQYIPGTLVQFIHHYERTEMHLALRRRGIEPLAHLLKLIQQAGAALSAAHARGIVHGGVLPGNILMDGQEHLWLADFGLARLHPPPMPYLAPELYSASQTSIQTGNMSHFWHAVTPASDQYMFSVLCQQLFARLLRPVDYEHLLPLLQRAMKSQPEQRFASCDIFIHELMSQATHTVETLARQNNSGIRQVHTSGNYPSVRPQVQQGAQSSGANYTTNPSGPQSPLDEWEKLGGKLFTAHDYGGAVKAYLRALEIDSRRAPLWLALGDAHFALERYSEALTAYEQAVQHDPNDPLAWSNRGTALDALGRRKEAAECYERADQLNS